MGKKLPSVTFTIEAIKKKIIIIGDITYYVWKN